MAVVNSTTYTSTGTATNIYATLASDYGAGVTGTMAFLNNSVAALDVFSLNSTLSITSHSKTNLAGHDPSANGTISLTGSGFGGTTGNLQTGTQGTITRAVFTGDAGGSFDITGSMRWAETTGIGAGYITSYHSQDVAGNQYTIIGQIKVQGAPGGLTFLGGTVSHVTLVTHNGFTFDILGKFDIVTNAGTITQFSVSDNAHHSVTMAGSFLPADVFGILGTAPTVADIFDSTLFNAHNDVYTIPDGVTHGWDGGAGNDRMTGGSGADTMSGGAGNDTLDGGAGADTMTGGIGDDTFFVNNALDVVNENNNEGSDTVNSTLTFTLGADFEKLILRGTGNIDGSGNASSNVLTGNSGNNMLDGMAGGVDTMSGGSGNDTYFVHNAADKIIEGSLVGGYDIVISDANTYVMADNVEEFRAATGVAVAATGNTLNNLMTGSTLVDTLNGGLGNDTLDGGTGNDLLNGGDGNDVYFVDSAGDVVTDSTGTDLVISSVDYTLGAGFENLNLAGAGVNGTGNELANIIVGNAAANSLSGLAGNDTLDGGAGADALLGGAGNDFYIVDNALDVLTELAPDGADTVQSSIDWTLGLNFENLILAGGAHVGTGNALANTITGGTGNDTLDGGTGADHLIGGKGDDIFYVDNLNDLIIETNNGGTDAVISSVNCALGLGVENVTLTGTAFSAVGNTSVNIITGNASANSLSGKDGDDTIDGGGGMDTISGGTGHDLFVMHNATAGQYVVTDFRASEDTIDISDLLTGFVNGVSNVGDFAHFIPGATGHSVLQIDNDGAVGGANFVTVMTVTGTNLDAQVLANSGHLILS